MKYDIASKKLLELGKDTILKDLLKIKVSGKVTIEDLPTETVRTKRTDFALKLKQESGEQIIVLEFQTYWKESKCLDLLDYRNDFKRKYALPIRSYMLLFTESGTAVNKYEDEEVVFNFNLVKMWEILATDYLDDEFIKLWPFIPLMKDGLKYVERIERELYQSKLEEKVDLLTILSIFVGLRDKKLALELLKRGRHIMIESPIYEIIEKEGELKKALETAKKLFEEGMSLEFVIKITGLTKKELEKEDLI